MKVTDKKLKKIESLAKYLEERATEEEKKRWKEKDAFTRGLKAGNQNTLELCAQWIREIIEEE